MSFDRFLLRIVQLIKEDEELREALLEFIRAKTDSEKALAEYRRRRAKS